MQEKTSKTRPATCTRRALRSSALGRGINHDSSPWRLRLARLEHRLLLRRGLVGRRRLRRGGRPGERGEPCVVTVCAAHLVRSGLRRT